MWSVGAWKVENKERNAQRGTPSVPAPTNNIAKKNRRVKCAFLRPFHTVRPPKTQVRGDEELRLLRQHRDGEEVTAGALVPVQLVDQRRERGEGAEPRVGVLGEEERRRELRQGQGRTVLREGGHEGRRDLPCERGDVRVRVAGEGEHLRVSE